MNISAHQKTTNVLFRKFNLGLLKLQQENKLLLHGSKLIGCCIPYFSKYSAGVLYRRDLPLNLKNKVRRLLMRVFMKDTV